jgi:hypothetical protein
VALSSKWYTGRETREEKEKLEQTIRNSSFILDKVADLIEKQLDELNRTKVADYDKPSWPFFQADRNGQKRALTTLLETLTAR